MKQVLLVMISNFASRAISSQVVTLGDLELEALRKKLNNDVSYSFSIEIVELGNRVGQL